MARKSRQTKGIHFALCKQDFFYSYLAPENNAQRHHPSFRDDSYTVDYDFVHDNRHSNRTHLDRDLNIYA